MRIVILGNYAPSLVNFRGPLIRSLVLAGHEVIACAPDKHDDTRERLAALGATFRPIDFERTGMNPRREARTVRAFVKLFRDTRPDVAFTYTIKPIAFGTIAARIAGVPRVVTMVNGLGHAFLDTSPKGRALRFVVENLYRVALSAADAVLFQNADDRDFFLRERVLFRRSKTAITNGSGVDVDFYEKAPMPDGPTRFLLVARLLSEKGIREYAAAARIVKRERPDVRVQLLGPFDEHAAALSRGEVEAWVNDGLIDYLGETKDVRPYLKSAHVFVLPSYSEGTPRSVLEAMATGRAIITTDAPGCRQTTVHGETGLLVPLKDATALAAAMVKLVDDRALVEKMGDAARTRCVEIYDVHKVNETIVRALVG